MFGVDDLHALRRRRKVLAGDKADQARGEAEQRREGGHCEKLQRPKNASCRRGSTGDRGSSWLYLCQRPGLPWELGAADNAIGGRQGRLVAGKATIDVTIAGVDGAVTGCKPVTSCVARRQRSISKTK